MKTIEKILKATLCMLCVGAFTACSVDDGNEWNVEDTSGKTWRPTDFNITTFLDPDATDMTDEEKAATTFESKVTFSDYSVAKAVKYQIQLCNDENFEDDNMFLDVTVEDKEYTIKIEDATESHTYYPRVRAINANGAYSEWVTYKHVSEGKMVTNITTKKLPNSEGGDEGSDEPAPEPDADGIYYPDGSTQLDFLNVTSITNSTVIESDGFKMTFVDNNSKMSVDDNSQMFGAVVAESDIRYTSFTKRLKTGGKSSSNLGVTLTVPSDGRLYICIRSGSSSDTRSFTITQNDVEILSQPCKDADGKKVTMGTDQKTLFPIYAVDVKAGEVKLGFTAAMYFYGIAFKAK